MATPAATNVEKEAGLPPKADRAASAGRRKSKADDANRPASAGKEKRKSVVGGDEDNEAFVFIKPHAVTDAVKKLVVAELAAKGIKIVKEGSIGAADIEKKKLIDNHYYAIASKATLLKPDQLAVPEDKFKEAFKTEWKEVLKAGTAVNAVDACAKFGLDAAGLQTEWKKQQATKFGGGFYCAKIDTVKDKPPLYVFNAFFLGMRAAFVAPGASIYYYQVQWPSSKLSWKQFRGEVLGPTDPAKAGKDSIRGKILAQWKDLGLKAEPNGSENGVHASASPFEGLAERLNWLGGSIKDDNFGKKLLAAGLTEQQINAWKVDARVKLPSGGEGSVFDSLEDKNCKEVVDILAGIAKANPGGDKKDEKKDDKKDDKKDGKKRSVLLLTGIAVLNEKSLKMLDDSVKNVAISTNGVSYYNFPFEPPTADGKTQPAANTVWADEIYTLPRAIHDRKALNMAIQKPFFENVKFLGVIAAKSGDLDEKTMEVMNNEYSVPGPDGKKVIPWHNVTGFLVNDNFPDASHGPHALAIRGSYTSKKAEDSVATFKALSAYMQSKYPGTATCALLHAPFAANNVHTYERYVSAKEFDAIAADAECTKLRTAFLATIDASKSKHGYTTQGDVPKALTDSLVKATYAVLKASSFGWIYKEPAKAQ